MRRTPSRGIVEPALAAVDDLQAALTQAYVSSRLADLTMALGGALFAAGLGLASARPGHG